MKAKFRYLLVSSSLSIGEMDEHELSRGLVHYIGASNYFIANPRIFKTVGDHAFIMKVSLRGYSALVLALALMKHISGKECGFFTVYTSGTLKALYKYIEAVGAGLNTKVD
ncbi:MAG: Rpp14/Pop5 family protein [Candidatus Micrarchaeia archaeon]